MDAGKYILQLTKGRRYIDDLETIKEYILSCLKSFGLDEGTLYSILEESS